MRVAAGRFRDRVDIQEPDLVDNGVGGRRPRQGSERWKTVGSVRAEVVPLRGQEALREGIQNSVTTWRVTIRVRKGLTTGHRLIWNDAVMSTVVMNIGSIGLTDERDGLVLICTSGVAG